MRSQVSDPDDALSPENVGNSCWAPKIENAVCKIFSRFLVLVRHVSRIQITSTRELQVRLICMPVSPLDPAHDCLLVTDLRLLQIHRAPYDVFVYLCLQVLLLRRHCPLIAGSAGSLKLSAGALENDADLSLPVHVDAKDLISPVLHVSPALSPCFESLAVPVRAIELTDSQVLHR